MELALDFLNDFVRHLILVTQLSFALFLSRFKELAIKFELQITDLVLHFELLDLLFHAQMLLVQLICSLVLHWLNVVSAFKIALTYEHLHAWTFL